MKREKELAEKRKNEPPLELSHDHPVRKLISRFRKISVSKGSTPNNNSDAERGEQTPNNIQLQQIQNPLAANGGTNVINVSEKSNVNSSRAAAASKWGKFLAGAGSGGGSGSHNDNFKAGDTTTGAKVTNAESSLAVAAPTKSSVGPKPASKWGKLLGKTQEPIQEASEDEEAGEKARSNLLRKAVLHADAAGHAAADVGGKLEQTAGISAADDAPLTQRDIVCSVAASSSLSATEQQLIASLYDIKLEIKEEIETLGQKMNRIDLQIGDILKLFSPQVSPFHPSHTPTSISSRMQSSTESNSCNSSTAESTSLLTSPKGSVPSSPRRSSGSQQPGQASETFPVSHLDSSRSVTPPTGGSKAKVGPGGPSSVIPQASHPGVEAVVTQDSRAGSAGSGSSRRSSGSKRKKSGGRTRVAPTNADSSGTAPRVSPPPAPQQQQQQPAVDDDEDRSHIKDRDLDIL